MGFRKGADVDEELWPTESFGGVSDEQFWDDLASDKPLTTTARTAQQDPGTRNRSLKAVPSPAATPAAAAPPAATPPAATQPVRNMAPQVPGATQPVRNMAPQVPGATQPVRNMAPQVPGATQPVRNMAPQVPGATQPVRNMAPQVPGVTEPVRATTGPSPLTSTSSQPPGASQPPSAAARPAETRGRRRARRSDEEDPLTSAAFSLRTSGPVDGRSSRRSRDMAREQHDASVAQETQTFSAAETEAASGGYPGGVPPFRQSESSAGSRSPSSYPGASHGDPSSVTQAMSTPPYGENYGYGGGSSPVLPEEPRRPNGTRSHARHGGTGEVTRASRQAYPQDSSEATRGYPSSDGYPGTGSYPGDGYPAGGYPTGGYLAAGQQGNGHQTGSYLGGTQPSSAHQSGAYPGGHQGNADAYRGNSHRAPYDPRDDYRRLTHLG